MRSTPGNRPRSAADSLAKPALGHAADQLARHVQADGLQAQLFHRLQHQARVGEIQGAALVPAGLLAAAPPRRSSRQVEFQGRVVVAVEEFEAHHQARMLLGQRFDEFLLPGVAGVAVVVLADDEHIAVQVAG